MKKSIIEVLNSLPKGEYHASYFAPVGAIGYYFTPGKIVEELSMEKVEALMTIEDFISNGFPVIVIVDTHLDTNTVQTRVYIAVGDLIELLPPSEARELMETVGMKIPEFIEFFEE